MSRCFYCEGSYLPPKKRRQKNPKYAIHESCLWEMLRANSEVGAVIKFLRKETDEELKPVLKRIEEFHNRMEKVRKQHKK